MRCTPISHRQVIWGTQGKITLCNRGDTYYIIHTSMPDPSYYLESGNLDNNMGIGHTCGEGRGPVYRSITSIISMYLLMCMITSATWHIKMPPIDPTKKYSRHDCAASSLQVCESEWTDSTNQRVRDSPCCSFMCMCITFLTFLSWHWFCLQQQMTTGRATFRKPQHTLTQFSILTVLSL